MLNRTIAVWILYLVVVLAAAALGMYGFGYYFLFGLGVVILSIIFGAWNGITCVSNLRDGVKASIASASIVSFIAGFFNFMFILALQRSSLGFNAAYILYSYPSNAPMVISALASWLTIMLIATASSATVTQLKAKK